MKLCSKNCIHIKYYVYMYNVVVQEIPHVSERECIPEREL